MLSHISSKFLWQKLASIVKVEDCVSPQGDDKRLGCVMCLCKQVCAFGFVVDSDEKLALVKWTLFVIEFVKLSEKSKLWLSSSIRCAFIFTECTFVSLTKLLEVTKACHECEEISKAFLAEFSLQKLLLETYLNASTVSSTRLRTHTIAGLQQNNANLAF